MRPRKDLDRVRAHVERHLHKRLTVPGLARLAGLSPYHFIRAFRAETGATPHQYIRTLRLERAKHLLSTTPMPVTDVCEAVGFESLGSFSSLFRRMTGLSPAAYRASHRRNVYVPGCFVRMYRLGR
jgi:transcriptional regulator GlxA family with amidase domain